MLLFKKKTLKEIVSRSARLNHAGKTPHFEAPDNIRSLSYSPQLSFYVAVTCASYKKQIDFFNYRHSILAIHKHLSVISFFN
jgi:hypothetical protein